MDNTPPSSPSIPTSGADSARSIALSPPAVPRTPRTSSIRETFSAPPLFSHSPGQSLSSTPPNTRPNTATSSALQLSPAPPGHTPAASLSAVVPGLASPFPLSLPLPTPIDDYDLGGNKDKPLKSHLLQGPVEKPWLTEKDNRSRISYFITLITSFLGVAASAVVCWRGYSGVSVITDKLCPVFEDNFHAFDVDSPGATWRHEVDLGGFGNGEFEMTTASSTNSFVRDGKLYIVPTLTADTIKGGNASIFDAFTFNATGCTSTTNLHGANCGAVSNTTSGTIINPIQSARITTQLSHSIRYGKVEVRARMPKGDWLWPAIWMMPVNDTYGPWPLSGEIDIVESHGNGPLYPAQGINVVRSSLNWGPALQLNSVFRTFGWWAERRTTYADDFHTFTLEWTPDFIRVFVDTRLNRMIDLRFDVPFFTRGKFPPTIVNNSQTIALNNPWAGRGNSAPFDQPFFLIMNVAVGGTNGWFPDNAGGKPWVDGSATAMRDFALAQDKWYPTWSKNVEQRAMVVDYVKMWKLC